jgi:hypothetical protein
VAALEELLPVGEVGALAEPVVGNCPTPRVLPICEPVIPCFIVDAAYDSVDKAGNRWHESGLDELADLLIMPGLLDLPNSLVPFAVRCDIAPFDRVDQRHHYEMRVMELPRGLERSRRHSVARSAASRCRSSSAYSIQKLGGSSYV